MHLCVTIAFQKLGKLGQRNVFSYCLKRLVLLATSSRCHHEAGPTLARDKRAQNVVVGTELRDLLFALLAFGLRLVTRHFLSPYLTVP